MALTAVSLIALGVPITRGHAGAQGSRSASGDGLAASLSTHAETAALALAEDASYRSALNSLPGAGLVPPSLLAAAGRVAALGAMPALDGESALTVQRQQAAPFTIHKDGFVSSQLSAGLTVGQALAGLGIKLGPHDLVSPGPNATLTPGLHVYIRYADRVELSLGGQRRTLYTRAATVGDLLAEVGAQLGPLDRVSPAVTTPVRQGMSVDVTTVREALEQVADPISFDTVYWDGPDLPEGSESLVQAGSAGYVRRQYRVIYVNGAEVSRQLLSETVEPPTDEIVSLGSFVATAPAPPAAIFTFETPECARTMTVYATWYTAASAGGNGRTATGTGVYRGIIAVDPWVIRLGTRMYVPGYGYGVAADTGGGIIGNMIDLGYGDYDVYDWGSRWVDICILD